MQSIQTKITEQLRELAEPEYGAFSAKLLPNIGADHVLGVRLPALRKMAKELAKDPQISDFLSALPHRYLEEDHLHSFIIAEQKNFEECIALTERFLPYINNWATCDSLRPKCFKKDKAALLACIERWLDSPHPYTVRFAVGMLMCHFLEADFNPAQLARVAAIASEEYYVNMMRAWYFATALAKQYESTLPLIESRTLDVFTQNKTIQKACESYRVSPAHQQYLRAFKVKTKR